MSLLFHINKIRGALNPRSEERRGRGTHVVLQVEDVKQLLIAYECADAGMRRACAENERLKERLARRQEQND